MTWLSCGHWEWTRDEIRDEIWDAMMNRMDIDVSTTDLADAALERLESLGLIASTPDTRRMVETPKSGSMRSAGSGLPEGSSK